MGLCLRTLVLIYLVEVSGLCVVMAGHRDDVRHFSKVVHHMVWEFRR